MDVTNMMKRPIITLEIKMTTLSDILEVVDNVVRMIDDAMDEEGVYDLYDAKYYLENCKDVLTELTEVEAQSEEEDLLANGFIEEEFDT
jgi:hypothetical protein